MELLDLPNELLIAIIVLIGGFDILPCRLVSESTAYQGCEDVSFVNEGGTKHRPNYIITLITTDLQTGARAHRL